MNNKTKKIHYSLNHFFIIAAIFPAKWFSWFSIVIVDRLFFIFVWFWNYRKIEHKMRFILHFWSLKTDIGMLSYELKCNIWYMQLTMPTIDVISGIVTERTCRDDDKMISLVMMSDSVGVFSTQCRHGIHCAAWHTNTRQHNEWRRRFYVEMQCK